MMIINGDFNIVNYPYCNDDIQCTIVLELWTGTEHINFVEVELL